MLAKVCYNEDCDFYYGIYDLVEEVCPHCGCRLNTAEFVKSQTTVPVLEKKI